MTKRSMPPPFHANLFAPAAARCCHDIGGFVIANRLVQSNLTPLRQIRWAGPIVADGVVV